METVFLRAQAWVRQVGWMLLSEPALQAEDIRQKSSHQDLVTRGDVWVQDRLCEGLGPILPEAGIYAEEKTNDALDGLNWIIDPIDGTANFVSRAKDYALCVALYEGQTPLFGLVYDPVQDRLYHALAGQGAFVNGRPLRTCPQEHLEASVLDSGLASINALSRAIDRPCHLISRRMRAHRALGSAALAMCQIAEGRLQAYFSSKLMPWDYAAAGIILEAAGGFYDPFFPTQKRLDPGQTPVLACADRPTLEALRQAFYACSDTNT